MLPRYSVLLSASSPVSGSGGSDSSSTNSFIASFQSAVSVQHFIERLNLPGPDILHPIRLLINWMYTTMRKRLPTSHRLAISPPSSPRPAGIDHSHRGHIGCPFGATSGCVRTGTPPYSRSVSMTAVEVIYLSLSVGSHLRLLPQFHELEFRTTRIRWRSHHTYHRLACGRRYRGLSRPVSPRASQITDSQTQDRLESAAGLPDFATSFRLHFPVLNSLSATGGSSA